MTRETNSPVDYAALDARAQALMARRKAHPMRETGFIYKHGKRAAVGVIELRKRITGDSSHDDALRVAAMFHDIGKGIEPHAVSGEALMRAMLADLIPADLLEEAAHLIGLHNAHGTQDPWARILMDADILDHFGALEVCMSFQYGAYDEKGLDTSLEWYRDGFFPYCDRTRKKLFHGEARTIFDEKVAFARAFLARLEIEATGAFV